MINYCNILNRKLGFLRSNSVLKNQLHEMCISAPKHGPSVTRIYNNKAKTKAVKTIYVLVSYAEPPQH